MPNQSKKKIKKSALSKKIFQNLKALTLQITPSRDVKVGAQLRQRILAVHFRCKLGTSHLQAFIPAHTIEKK